MTPMERTDMPEMAHAAAPCRRHGAIGVHSIDRFVFSVPDIDRAEHFYRAFGLDVKRVGQRLELFTFGHPHCWGHVHQDGEHKRLQYLRMGVYAEDWATLLARVDSVGAGAPAHPWGDGDGLWARCPDGLLVQLVVAPKVSPSVKSPKRPELPLPPGVGAAPARSQVSPVRPRHLSHVLLFTPDVPAQIAFMTSVLGLRLSDRSGDLIAFLHGAHGSDHHLVALARSGAPGLHHTSWDVASVDEVGGGGEQMRAAGYADGWGVGRHVLGSNYFQYVRDPWGSYAEYSFDIDFVPHDVDWQAGDHAPEDALYVWGPAVPADFTTNFEHSA